MNLLLLVCLSIAPTPGLQVSTCLSFQIHKTLSILTLLFSAIEFGLWNQMLSVVLI